MLKIFISGGEHSGDLLGACLIRALKNELDTQNHIDFQGVGGPLMEREGFKSLFDFSLLSVMGIKDIFINLIPILSWKGLNFLLYIFTLTYKNWIY